MILIPIGTKAQLIKMAPVLIALERRQIEFDFVLTGQHQETMDDLINGFTLPSPKYSLARIEEADTSTKLASWLLKVLCKHAILSSSIQRKNYQYCLVHGDTMSTLVGAIIARRHGIKVAHVEAGLRSHNIFHPFPEEITRLLVSQLSTIFYCSGGTAIENVRKFRKNPDIVDIGDNTLLDSVRFTLNKKPSDCHLKTSDRYCVVSVHRFENISNVKRLRFITENILKFSKKIDVKFVLHAATRHKLQDNNLMSILENSENIELLPRMRYFEFIQLISGARFLVSDGGSNQEECSYLGIPCLLMRQKTEREEGLDSNVVLSEYDTKKIWDFFDKYSSKCPTPSASLDHFRSQPSDAIADDMKRRLANYDNQ